MCLPSIIFPHIIDTFLWQVTVLVVMKRDLNNQSFSENASINLNVIESEVMISFNAFHKNKVIKQVLACMTAVNTSKSLS